MLYGIFEEGAQPYKLVGSYQDYFKLHTIYGGRYHLAPIRTDGVFHDNGVFKYLSDYDRCRILEWPISVDVQFSRDLRSFKISIFTNNEAYINKDLNDLAHAIGMAILNLEKDLYNQYQEELLSKSF